MSNEIKFSTPELPAGEPIDPLDSSATHSSRSPQVDHAAINPFVEALFRYADEDTYASLRAFDQFDSTKPSFAIEAVKLNGPASG